MLEIWGWQKTSSPALPAQPIGNMAPSMLSRSRFALSSLLLSAVVTPPAFAGGAIETRDFAEVVGVAEKAIAQYGAESVLLVCDIDNTLLAMNGELGSDQWFEWQNYLLEHEPDSKDLIAASFDELLAAQGILFTLGKMHPPQPEIPDHIAALQEAGVDTLVLTSRGDEYRDATERELRANGYDFERSVLPVTSPPCGVYLPYDLSAIGESGLTAEEAALFRLSDEPRGVSFGAGVMMCAGQHKGAMLLTMLARAERSYRAVVFVDDHGRHVVRVYDALARRGIDVTAFHYKVEDTAVARFRYSDKEEVARNWKRLDKTLQAVFE